MTTATDELSERDHAILRFEAGWWKYAGAKEQEIRDRFDLTATRYYQALNALIDRPDAEREYPALIHRLRRIRDARSGARRRRATN